MKHPFSATILPLLAVFGAACDSGSVHHALVHTSVLEAAAAAPAATTHTPLPPAYFGDEYADVQRTLADRRDEPAAPTF